MKLSKELVSGIIAVIAIVLVYWGLNYMKKQNLFTTSDIYYSEFENIQGLTTASIVTINGFQVGNINSIKFNSKKKGNLIVAFTMDEDFSFSKNSTTKITPGLMGGAELSIIPNYEGENAVSGDILKGISEKSMISSLADKFDPIQANLNTTLESSDKLLMNFNNLLDSNTKNNIKSAISNLNITLSHFKNVSKSMEEMLADNKVKFGVILDNTSDATKSLKNVTSEIEQAKLASGVKETIAKLNTSLANVDKLLSNMNNGKGSIGKLLNDDGLYNNLENATKEMEELMREMKEHPKRFVHFSLFGKKDKKGYVKDTVKIIK